MAWWGAKRKVEWPKPANGSFWTFAEVFSAEYADIHARCPKVAGGPPKDQTPSVNNGLVGLALSGGGNRSSTFCLGVLQALNACGALKNIHYLSTVSGGGYIGTAMTVGTSLGGTFPFGKTGQDVGETPETKHLRDTSRYLLQNGLSSAISAAAIYLRGIVMNLIVVLPFVLIAAGLLVISKPDTSNLAAAWPWMQHLPAVFRNSLMPLSALSLTIVLGLLVVYALGVSISPIISLEKRRRIAVVAAVVMVLFIAIVLFEAHLVVLRYVFERHGAAIAEASVSNLRAQVPDTLVDTLRQIVTLITPVTVAMLPFLRSIATQATSQATGGISEIIKRWLSRLALLFSAAVVPLLLWVAVLQVAYWGIGVSECMPKGAPNCTLSDTWVHAPEFLKNTFAYAAPIPATQVDHCVGLGYLGAAVVFLLIWPFLNVNANSLHQLYRDRLGSAFLATPSASGADTFTQRDNFLLSEIKAGSTPYHILNTALNVPGSKYANRRGRNAEFFIFSRCFVGSEATGYVWTEMAEHVNDGLNIGTAMAISGAAAAPNMGMASMRPLSPTIAFLNVRLGRWLRHPIETIKDVSRSSLARWWEGKPGPLFLLREAFSKSGSDIVDPNTEVPLSTGFVFLTDGGHIENLGVYELLRRRCALIIAVDAEADPELTSGSLVQLEQFARIDLGTNIVMDWKSIGGRSREVSEEVTKRSIAPAHGPHVALGLIDYPGIGTGPRERGVLVYIKSSLSGDENDYVLSYKATHPSFPHETTMDQLFTEEQFEAYRALGEHIARRFLQGKDRATRVADLDDATLHARLALLD